MMLIYGEPDSQVMTSFETLETSWDQCYSICYWMDSCGVAYYASTKCQLYSLGLASVKKLENSDGKRVGIKIFSDTCSSQFNNIWIDTNQAHNFSISSDSTHWTISYNIVECDNTTRIFQRNNIFVCIGFGRFSVNVCRDYYFANETCHKDGWTSMTSPATWEEAQYLMEIRDKVTALVYTNRLIWVDGRNGVFQDPTHNGYDGMLCGNQMPTECAVIGYKDSCGNVTATDCTNYDVNNNCYRGVACRKEWIIVL